MLVGGLVSGAWVGPGTSPFLREAAAQLLEVAAAISVEEWTPQR